MSALVYGATGYTGALVARAAAAAGLAPVLAGRRAPAALAAELGLPARAFGLDDPAGLRAALDGITVVLCAAGPFEVTALPLLDACLAAGVHYLDLAGEVPAFAAAQRRTPPDASVMVLPGAGFGVVATDLAAAAAAAALTATAPGSHTPPGPGTQAVPPVRGPEPVCERPDEARPLPAGGVTVGGVAELDIAFRTVGGVSRGTVGGLLPVLHRAGVTRVGGALVAARPGSRTLRTDLGGPVTAVLNPWRADLLTAALSTGAPTVTTYQVLPAPLRLLMRAPAGLLDSRAWQGLVRAAVRRLPDGPGERQRATGAVHVRAVARDADGRTTEAALHGPEAYLFTARSAVALLRRVLAGDAPPGFRTPTTAYGTALAAEIEGVTLDVTPRDPASRASPRLP